MQFRVLIKLFITFLKIGATSFGGYMALVAVVKRELVDREKLISENDLLDAISLASLLPGPVAVNVVAYVGGRIRGFWGMIISVLGVVVPSVIFVIALSYLYFSYGDIPSVTIFFRGTTAAITAVIASVGIGMVPNVLKSGYAKVVCTASALLLIFIGGLNITIAIMLGAMISALIKDRSTLKRDLHKDKERGEISLKERTTLRQRVYKFKSLIPGSAILVGIFLICLLFRDSLEVQILSIFSTLSLTLVGGGYVVIPALHELFVDNLGWLTSTELADGISIGQITPGPIFISAAFIGYKMLGVKGALLATIGIFTPPAILIFTLSKYVDKFKKSPIAIALFSGIRPAVLGMILASAVIIGEGIDPSFITISIGVVSLILLIRYKVSPIYIIPLSGVISLALSYCI